jgi:hypothetical protein
MVNEVDADGNNNIYNRTILPLWFRRGRGTFGLIFNNIYDNTYVIPQRNGVYWGWYVNNNMYDVPMCFHRGRGT